jgi:hypothetical protein
MLHITPTKEVFMKLKSILSFSALMFSLSSFAQIYSSKVDLYDQYDRDTWRKNARQIVQESLAEYERFSKIDVHRNNVHAAIDAHKPRNLGPRDAEMVLRETDRNPVVSMYMNDKYDPNDEGIGFCFGRAMFVHMYLAMKGLHRASMMKAFVVGPMKTDDMEWGWHVTTIAQSIDSRTGKRIWVAIDPILDRVVEVTEWYKEMRKISTNGRLRLYITEPNKFHIGPSTYDEDHLTIPWYNNYFKDMRNWFERESRKGRFDKQFKEYNPRIQTAGR